MRNYEQAFSEKLRRDEGSAVQHSRARIFFPECLYLLHVIVRATPCGAR